MSIHLRLIKRRNYRIWRCHGRLNQRQIIQKRFEFFPKTAMQVLSIDRDRTVVLSIGLSLINVGIISFSGGSKVNDYAYIENPALTFFDLVII